MFDVVQNHGKRIYEAPTVIKEAFFFSDRVLVLYHSDTELNRKLGTELTPMNRPDDEQLIGRNVLMINANGQVLWTAPNNLGMDSKPYGCTNAGYSHIWTEIDDRDDSVIWCASANDGYIYTFDLETGHRKPLRLDR